MTNKDCLFFLEILDRRLKLDIVLLQLFDKLLSDTDRCLKFPIRILEALVFMLPLFELLVFLIDFFLHLFAVILSLTPFQSLNFNFMRDFSIVFGQSATLILQLGNFLLFLTALDVEISNLLQLVFAFLALSATNSSKCSSCFFSLARTYRTFSLSWLSFSSSVFR